MLYLCTVSTKQNYTAYIEADFEDGGKAIAEERAGKVEADIRRLIMSTLTRLKYFRGVIQMYIVASDYTNEKLMSTSQ